MAMVQKNSIRPKTQTKSSISTLQKLRLDFEPILPEILQDIKNLKIVPKKKATSENLEKLAPLFPKTIHQPELEFVYEAGKSAAYSPLTVGVVLSGGQAPGGHNVITGLFDALKKFHPSSRLIGFCNGPKGIIQNKSFELTKDLLAPYRNQGGFDLIGAGREKIETPEHFQAAVTTVKSMGLDGLVIIGGDDSNTNAALLAEHFLEKEVSCRVVGVPKTIDGDLKNDFIELSFGFDTACKTYSEIIGNMARDSLSAKKYYYFIKMMGRSASHIVLECAMQTHPNLALIGEEAAERKKTIRQLTEEICDLICQRSEQGKNYGLILIPEGILEFIPEFKQLIKELNNLLLPQSGLLKKLDGIASRKNKIEYLDRFLSQEARACFDAIPIDIQFQLLLERDPHGNVQVSKIETERLFIELVKQELEERKKRGIYEGSFNPQPHFCGYEGRSGMPSNFDSQYCYALGHVAALLIEGGMTGYMSTVRHLTLPVDKWEIAGAPLVMMMDLEQRLGKEVPVIQKKLVDLQSKAFRQFQESRTNWGPEDDYRYPGPIQFFGPKELTDSFPLSMER